MEAMLGISLYVNQQKRFSFLVCLCLLFNKIRDKGKTGSAWNILLSKNVK
jgi:hypothetical protein